MKPPAVGGVVALAVVLVDQIVKAGVLAYFAGPDVDPWPLAPFLDLDAADGTGAFRSACSPGDSASAQIALVALTLAVTGLLSGGCFDPDRCFPPSALG